MAYAVEFSLLFFFKHPDDTLIMMMIQPDWIVVASNHNDNHRHYRHKHCARGRQAGRQGKKGKITYLYLLCLPFWASNQPTSLYVRRTTDGQGSASYSSLLILCPKKIQSFLFLSFCSCPLLKWKWTYLEITICAACCLRTCKTYLVFMIDSISSSATVLVGSYILGKYRDFKSVN